VTTSLRVQGVAKALEDVRQQVYDAMLERLMDRQRTGRLDLSEGEIATLAGIAATLARTAAADGIAEAYQWGINRAVSAEEHERPTTKPPTLTGEKPHKPIE